MNRSLRSALVLIFIFLLASCAGERSSNLEDLVHEYVDACNLHDLEKLRGMLTDAVVWYLGADTLVGKDQVLGPLAYDQAINTYLEGSNLVVKGDTVEFELSEKNDVLRALGIDELRHFPRFIFKDGLILEKGPRKPYARAQELEGQLATFREWLQENHPDDLARLEAQDGSFIYNRDNGYLVVKLLKIWAAERQSEHRE